MRRSPATLTAHAPLAPQTMRVLRALQERTLTARDAMMMDPPCYRLAARVAEIREAFGDGAVETISEDHGSGRHARYRLTLGEGQGVLDL